MNPINAIGAISMHHNGEETFLGTAFCYKSPRFLLTASHVIPSDPKLLSVTFPYTQRILVPTKIARHESSDVAALACTSGHVNNRQVDGIEYFRAIEKNLQLAADFITYGYPEDISLGDGSTPTPRVFKGYFQRLFKFASSRGHYTAIELSVSCPAGLSGAPILLYGNASTLAGIVAENVETTTELREEEAEPGKIVTYRRVINYGVAVRLADITSWIDEHFAEFDS